MEYLKKIIPKQGGVYRTLKSLLSYVESKTGTRLAIALHKEELARPATLENGLISIQQRWPNAGVGGDGKPIFILSAGWRSGSTLLQRLLMSKNSLLVWGEPYSHSGIFDGLSQPVRAISNKWPADNWIIDQYDTSLLSQLWVANLYPEISRLRKANISYMETLFREPAEERGFSTWGIKDVRLTIDHAHYLKWLYPDAKFLFLFRNPYHAYASYRQDRTWYKQWPDKPVFTPKAFAEHWFELLSGYVDGCDDIGGMLVKYEELCSDSFDVEPLENYLGLKLDPTVINNIVGASNLKIKDTPQYELRQVRSVVKPLAEHLGYKYGDWM